MKLVTKSEEISALLQKVKESSHAVLTNFYIDQEKLATWINKRLIYYIESENGILFFRKGEGFYHLYYFTSSLSDLQRLAKSSFPTAKVSVDVIGKVVSIENVVSLFIGAGFKQYARLNRYTRINKVNSNYYQPSEQVTIAKEEDAATIAQMFKENFDKLSEQVPDLTEVKKIIEDKKVLVIKEGQTIKGFLVRTFTGQTTILNNFFVDKSFRGDKIGSKLLKHYIFESKDARRMMLWVLADNEVALNIYRRHEYQKEDLTDVILIN